MLYVPDPTLRQSTEIRNIKCNRRPDVTLYRVKKTRTRNSDFSPKSSPIVLRKNTYVFLGFVNGFSPSYSVHNQVRVIEVPESQKGIEDPLTIDVPLVLRIRGLTKASCNTLHVWFPLKCVVTDFKGR